MEDTDEITEAMTQWLSARANFHIKGRDYSAAFCMADARLLAAFAAGWNPRSPRMLAAAFQGFRTSLAAGNE
jgi:hypothetical protein